MENLSHQFSRKNYTANGGFPPSSGGGKSMYDDVFGGAPKFGLNSLAPRLQDYTEIFGGFHSSRGSSIPVLDLPAVDVDEDDDAVDVRSSRFDYSEVFSRLNGVDFAVSFEDLVCEANGGYDSSDEAWSPAHSESLSGETDPSACSERSQRFPNADIHQSVNDIKQFNVSFHKAHHRSYDILSNGMAHITHLHAIPGYACVIDETAVSQKVDSEERPYQVPNELNYSHDFEERVVEEKRFSKSMSLPMNTGHGSYRNPSEKNSKSGPITNAPFLSVSDISLRTKPSQLPPPSRPPPVLAVRKGESGKPHSKLKASKSYAFERVAGDKLSPFFDVKLDGYSSAATTKDAVEETQSNLRSTEKVMEGKEGLQSCMKLQVEDDMNVMERNMIRTFDKYNDFVGDRLQGTWAKEGSGTETFAEERKRVTKTGEIVAEGIDWEIDVSLFEKSAEREHRRTLTSSQGSFKREEAVAWREAAEFFEVETDNSWMSFEQVKAKNISERDVESRENRQCINTAAEPFEQKESYNKVEAAKEAPEWEDNHNQQKVAESPFQWIGGEERSRTAKGSSSQLENQKNKKVNETIHELEANGEKLHMAQHGENGKLFDKDTNLKNLKGANQDGCLAVSKQEMKGASERTEKKKNVTHANSRKGNEMRSEEVFQREHCERRNKDTLEEVEFEKKANERLDQEQREKQQKESFEGEGKKKIHTEAFERKENENGLREALEQKNEEKLYRIPHGGSGQIRKMDLALEDYQREQQVALNRLEYKEMLRESRKQEEIEKELEASLEQDTPEIEQLKAYDRDSNDERLSHASGRKDYEMRPEEAMEQESSKTRSSAAFKEEQTEKQSKKANGQETIEHRSDNANKGEELSRKTENKEQIERNAGPEGGNFMAFENTWELNNESLYPSHLAGKHDRGEALPCENLNKLKIEIQGNEEESEDQLANLQFKERFNSCDKNQGVLQHEEHETRTEAVKDLPGPQQQSTEPNQVGTGPKKSSTRQVKVVSHTNDLENMMVFAPEVQRGGKFGGVQVTVDEGDMREKFTAHQVGTEWVDNAKNIGDALQAVLEDIGDIADTDETGKTQGTDTKEKNMTGIPLPEEPKIGKTLKKDREMEHEHFGATEEERERQREREKDLMAETQRVGERLKERELENELLKRIEEEREREREREKDRMAVDSAIREARERSYAEARERAERAAVERANTEVRQRAMAEARERLEKASAEAREVRTRAERAAVERATAEARQRAFGRAMAEKFHVDARDRAERSVDKLRSKEMKQSSSSSDIRFQSAGTSSGLRYTYSSSHVGVEGESPQRCKARLERYQRTAERAAKALAEKNMRDLVAQREQEERNRLAEILDAEVRRWSSGKEGNLRALLSTLQYILGPDSGWQPIPLTEVITSAAVKRAYRKATLCVHPDKLQQRGASIQQKYICEKVFDLLKDAWNKFNSEER